MSDRRTFVKRVAGTAAGMAIGVPIQSNASNKKEQEFPGDKKIKDLPQNPLVLFDNFHIGNRRSYSWKAKLAAADHAGFDGFEFVGLNTKTDTWNEVSDLFFKTRFKVMGFHGTTQAVIDGKAPEIDEEIDKIVNNVKALSQLPIKPYYSLSLSGRGELIGDTIAESGSARAEDRHWERAYKIVAAFDKACKSYGIVGALYPHTHWICDTPQSAFRILKGAKANTIGPSFCSHHWYANAASDELDEVLKNDYMKRLNYVVLTNGIFSPSNFQAVRFNEGQIDMAWMLAKIYEFGYTGPISTQGWRIGGDPLVACKQFVDTIRALRKRFSEHPELYPLI
ncbi:TIM barrel protein [Ulvibacterium sp.]|uniref:sugar phosphate isomerase/epimerase family protein n=1 Tax=Ulvibacterium sp. TaxID=2665914 RepID=UPI00262E57E5|nr:TIM barrel protein [Ulvibacterium sp.]